MAAPEKRIEQPLEMSIINEFIGNLLMGDPQDPQEEGRVRICRVQPDGTLRMWALQVGVDETGQERVFLTELDGTFRVSLQGTSPSGDILGIRVNENGELVIDASGAEGVACAILYLARKVEELNYTVAGAT